jgi:MFS family permease
MRSLFLARRLGASPAHRAGGRSTVRDIVGAVMASTATGLAVFLVGALAVEMRPSLHLSLSGLGATVSLYYLAATVGSIPAGRLAERVGSIPTMRAAAVAGAVTLLLMAFFARSFASLSVFMVLAGLASSCMQPATNRFLIRRIPDRRQGLAFGIKQSSIPLSAFLAGLAVPGIALTVGWRWAFGVAAAVAASAALLIPRRRGRQHGERAARAARGHSEAMALGVLAIGFGLGIFATTGLTAFLVLSAVAAGISKGAAGLVAGLAGGSAVIARIFTGLQADRRGHSHFLIVAAMLSGGVAGYVALAVGSATDNAAVFIMGAVVAYAAGWGWNGLFNFAVARSYVRAPARAAAVTQAAGRLAGVVGPLLFGLVVTHVSYAAAWLMSAGLALAAAVVILLGGSAVAAAQRRLSPVPVPAREGPG